MVKWGQSSASSECETENSGLPSGGRIKYNPSHMQIYNISGFVGWSTLLSGISAVWLKLLFLLLIALGDQLPKQTSRSVINTSDGTHGMVELAPRGGGWGAGAAKIYSPYGGGSTASFSFLRYLGHTQRRAMLRLRYAAQPLRDVSWLDFMSMKLQEAPQLKKKTNYFTDY